MHRNFFLIAVLALAITGTASARSFATYAGLTKAQAITKAEKGILSLALMDGRTASQLVTAKRYMDSHHPVAKHATCRTGKKVWSVAWNGGDAIYVAKSGVVLGCR